METRERPRPSRPLLTVGEARLPDGRVFRSLLVGLIAIPLLALPLAGLLAAVRVEPVDIPAALERIIDPRTEGERAVAIAQARLESAPNDPRAMTVLAGAYLLRVRETADPTYYSKAGGLLHAAALALPDDPDVLVASGSLALSRHDFTRALELGRAAVRAAPTRPAAWGVLADALVELGRYDDAVAAAQRMVDLRPDLASLSRVSYLRELHGDLDGAIDAMRRAVAAGAPTSEATAWSEVQLGHLLFAKGSIDAAAQNYREAAERVPGYVYATAGLARVRAARGDLAGAADLYAAAAARLPVPDFVIALGDIYERLGNRPRAEQQYALVDLMARLLAANGVRVDADLALFAADHDRNVGAAVFAARAEYAVRPSVHVADILAWAEYKAADIASATQHSREALRLGTRDPLMLYRAGVIAQAAGESGRARELFEQSYALNPAFSVRWAPDLAARIGR